ncbi:PstS family phosphate ABC transporter substrate-binding protein [Ignatzschineria sp. LJL83]
MIAIVIAPFIDIQQKKHYYNLATINEQAFEIMAYSPFKKGNITAKLDQPSTLSLKENLPILDGARALYPVYAAFAQAVYPKGNYDFKNSAVSYYNTIEAYQRLISHQADMIFVVEPSSAQIQDAKDANVAFDLTPIGKDAFVFFVNKNNPIQNLTSEQIRDIYSGKITNWQQLGGNKEPIRAFQRNEGSGSQTAFLKFMQNTQPVEALQEDISKGMGSIIQQTANYRNHGNAIGFSFRFFAQTLIANGEIRFLSIDGVAPSVETIQTGEYPLTANFYSAVLEENTKPHIQELLDWILSEQGQELIEKTGYVPIQ